MPARPIRSAFLAILSLLGLLGVATAPALAADWQTWERFVPRINALAEAGSAGPDVIAALENYATLLREGGRERDAAMVARRAQRLREVRSSAAQGERLFFNPTAELRDYAALLRLRNRHAEAQAMEMLAAAEARNLINRYEKLRRDLSTDSAAPSLTWTWQVSGALEALEGRLYPEAEGLLRDAVRTAEIFASPDVRLAYALSVLAFAYRAQGKRDEFAGAVQRAMPILESAAGLNHSLLPRSLTVLALAHLRFDLGPAKTLAHLERALRILEKDLVRDHPIVGLHLAGLGASHLALFQPEQAKLYLERALAIAGQQYLPDHVPLAVSLMKVVDVYMDQGDYWRANAVARRVVEILGKMLDPDHPDVIRAAEAYRIIGQKMKRRAEVVSLASATTVPLQVEGNAMLVHATVNRSQRALLVVDTGASSTMMRPLVLTRLGMSVPADAPRRRMVVVTGLTVDVPFVTVTMQVGGATIEHLEVGVAEVLPGNPELDGFLGADFLQRFKVTLEKTARRMTLEPLPR